MTADEDRRGRPNIDPDLWLERLGRAPEELSAQEREELEHALRSDPELRQAASWITEVDALCRSAARRQSEHDAAEEEGRLAAVRDRVLRQIATEAPRRAAVPGWRARLFHYARFAAPAVVAVTLIGLFTLGDREEALDLEPGAAEKPPPPITVQARPQKQAAPERELGRSSARSVRDGRLQTAAPPAEELPTLDPVLGQRLKMVQDTDAESLDWAVADLLDLLEGDEDQAARSPATFTAEVADAAYSAAGDSVAAVLRRVLPNVSDPALRERIRRWLQDRDGSPD
jgi:hypothetical protein